MRAALRAGNRRERPKVLVPAQALFESALKKLGYDPAVYAVFEVWDRLLGPQAARARAVGLKGAHLHVEVDSSAHMHDLALRKRTLLKKLNEHFGARRVISDIIVRLAKSTPFPSSGAYRAAAPAGRFSRVFHPRKRV